MKRTRINQVLKSEEHYKDPILIKGWVRTKRESKGFSFLELNDGSCLENLQVVVEDKIDTDDVLKDIGTGASVEVTGDVVESPGKGQKWELQAKQIRLVGIADPETYPLQKKRHSDEFLRTISHLRARTNKYGALYRLRSELSFAIHDFFHERNFFYIHTPIITGLDCEGAGELFRVSSLDMENYNQKSIEDDFFGKKAYLTVSGQLTAETLACALGNVYTFGPTFRAEDSNTPRHAAEFWMVEPEVAFADLEEIIDLAEEFIFSIVTHIKKHSASDLALFSSFVDKSLPERLDMVQNRNFERLDYEGAIEILDQADKSEKFQYQPVYGTDLQTEHERFLTEKYFQKPVIVYNFPKDIKPFYMKVNPDNQTVGCLDVLLPHIGEIIGGSQREDNLQVLENRMDELGMNKQEYEWYLDLRRFGTVPHAGFGLGFERLLMFITGVSNIRDVIPFPRTPKKLDF